MLASSLRARPSLVYLLASFFWRLSHLLGGAAPRASASDELRPSHRSSDFASRPRRVLPEQVAEKARAVRSSSERRTDCPRMPACADGSFHPDLRCGALRAKRRRDLWEGPPLVLAECGDGPTARRNRTFLHHPLNAPQCKPTTGATGFSKVFPPRLRESEQAGRVRRRGFRGRSTLRASRDHPAEAALA